MKGLSLWDVLPLVCGRHAALTVQPAIRVRLQPILEPAHIMLYTSTSRQASAPNLQAGVCPGEPTGARRFTKAIDDAKKIRSSVVLKFSLQGLILMVEGFCGAALESE